MNSQQIKKPLHQDKQLSELVIQNPYMFLMLEHFGIDLMLQEKTVAQVCLETGIQTELFLVIANLYAGSENPTAIRYQQQDIQQIIQYLQSCHKFYKDEKYPQIKAYIQLIKKLNPNPEIVLLERFFHEYFKEVSEHLEYENSTVFPYIIDLLNKLDGELFPTNLVNYSVSEYKDHHDNIEEKLSDLKNLLIKYLPAGNDIAVRRKLLFALSELEFDLHIHSKIEDFVLIPLVEQMEQKLNNDHEK